MYSLKSRPAAGRTSTSNYQENPVETCVNTSNYQVLAGRRPAAGRPQAGRRPAGGRPEAGRTHACAHAHAYTHAHKHAHIHAQTYTYPHAHVPTYTLSHMCKPLIYLSVPCTRSSSMRLYSLETGILNKHLCMTALYDVSAQDPCPVCCITPLFAAFSVTGAWSVARGPRTP